MRIAVCENARVGELVIVAMAVNDVAAVGAERHVVGGVHFKLRPARRPGLVNGDDVMAGQPVFRSARPASLAP